MKNFLPCPFSPVTKKTDFNAPKPENAPQNSALFPPYLCLRNTQNFFFMLLVTGCLLAPAGTSLAAPGGAGVGIKGGTLGVGVEAGLSMSDYFTVRGGVNYLSFDFDTTIKSIDYNFEPTFFNADLLLDFHPFANAFRLTGGLYINNNEVDVDGVYRHDLLPPEYRQYSYITDQAHVKGTVSYNSLAPYLGIGWSSNQDGPGWGFNLDLGVLFQGKPEVSELHLEDPWGVGQRSELQTWLADKRQDIVDELDKYEYYPVASITVKYSF